MKTKILVSLLAVLILFSCGKKDDLTSLSGTSWKTTYNLGGGEKLDVLLKFTDGSKGVLTVSGSSSSGINMSLTFTYTYNKPNVEMRPTDPEYVVDLPNGCIRGTVHDKVINVVDSESLGLGKELALTRK